MLFLKFVFGIQKLAKENWTTHVKDMQHYLICVYLGLQMTDVELDARVTDLEENGGASQNRHFSRQQFLFEPKR